jgi:excisionase family DNA binding protein
VTLPRAAYRPREAAEMLGVSEPTVLRWARSGVLPALRMGRRWLILDSGNEGGYE